MLRFLLAILVLAGLVFAFLFLYNMPWTTTLDTGELSYELPLWVGAAALLVLGLLIAFVLWLLGGLWNLPKSIKAARRRARSRKGNEALANGLLALEGGDLKQATRFAEKAVDAADDERIALLLEARAAEQRKDWVGAERAYLELSRKPNARLAALRGLSLSALNRGDPDSAADRAREALTGPGLKTDWSFETLFGIEVRRGAWDAALEALSQAEKFNLLPADPARRRRAVLLTAKGADADAQDSQEADRLYGEAIKLAPSFTPAALLGARRSAGQSRHKQAENLLETAWRARPHGAIVRAVRDLVKGEDARDALLGRLAASGGQDREADILKAELAIGRTEWLAAAETLAPLLEQKATARLFSLMEQVARGQGDEEAARRWARLAANAPPEGEPYLLGPGQTLSAAEWAKLVYIFGDTGALLSPDAPPTGPLGIAHQPGPAESGKPRDEGSMLPPPTDYVAPDKPDN